MEMTIRSGTPGAKDEILQLFQLTCLVAILRTSERQATAREITDIATAMYRRRLDAAQTHIALTRLTERGLTEVVTPQTGTARHFAVTERGATIARETMAIMRSVLAAVDDGTPNITETFHDAKKGRRHTQPFPKRALP